MKLTFSFSPCPNDCFMFEAIVNRRVELEGLEFRIQLADVETLNRVAFAGSADLTKLSFHAYSYCANYYVLLDAGSALGWNCGPVFISKRPISNHELHHKNLRIAIPGKFTTANLLLNLALPQQHNKSAMVFSDIESAVLAGEFDAGLVIHENRFTYEAKGLKKIVDLGEYWQKETGRPLPLGGIAMNRSLSPAMQQKVNGVLRRSVEYALAHPAASRKFVLAHAQETSEAVVSRHIDLYVNQYSICLGVDGRDAIEALFEKGRVAGCTPPLKKSLFLN
jgi:1,4-dihydroxy-6-naphthoate synthase